ncbi:MAG TPA: rhomboid family intramembrane serine protease [Gammaproteobacteria bacterium]|nr:rhomboid family intramembrane serine protease [Gammaproteobacteria bacterium]
MFPIHDTVPRRNPPLIVWSLIALNTAIFLFELELPPPAQKWFLYHFGLVPARYSDPAWGLMAGLPPWDYLPFLSNMFLHGGWAHLIGNMWTLWLFGSAVEDRLGRLRFVVFYLACGLMASGVHYYFNLDARVPALGASGAIAGVIGAYGSMFPLARILFVIPIFFFPFFFELPAMLYAAFWFLLQFLQGTGELLAPRFGGGIAWWAHVGGFAAGVVLIRILVPAARRRRGYFPDEGVLGYGPRGEPR